MEADFKRESETERKERKRKERRREVNRKTGGQRDGERERKRKKGKGAGGGERDKEPEELDQTEVGTRRMGVETQRQGERAGPELQSMSFLALVVKLLAQKPKSKHDSGPTGLPQWPLCGRREGLHCGAGTDCLAALAWVGALAWASLFQAFLPHGGTGKGKDCSKVSGTCPGKAWWRLLGFTWLSALGTGLFWELSSQNTSPSPCSRATGC